MNSLGALNSIIDTVESDLEKRKILPECNKKIKKRKGKKEVVRNIKNKKISKNKDTLRNSWGIVKQTYVRTIMVPDGEKIEKKGRKLIQKYND